MVDDIDYFTFPKQYLQLEIEKTSKLDKQIKIYKYKKSKELMIIALLNF